MATINSLLKKTLIFIIQLYRYSISALLGPCCRFSPSCSNYAIEAITTRGLVRGSLLAIKRVLRCHPWHSGGVDPVPPTKTT